MAPEQLQASRYVTARSDIWSLGVVLFCLISGRLPFATTSNHEVATAIARGSILRLSQVKTGVSLGLDEAIARCLAHDPTQRFANVSDLANALAPFGTPAAERSRVRIAHVWSQAAPSSATMDPAPIVSGGDASSFPHTPSALNPHTPLGDAAPTPSSDPRAWPSAAPFGPLAPQPLHAPAHPPSPYGLAPPAAPAANRTAHAPSNGRARWVLALGVFAMGVAVVVGIGMWVVRSSPKDTASRSREDDPKEPEDRSDSPKRKSKSSGTPRPSTESGTPSRGQVSARLGAVTSASIEQALAAEGYRATVISQTAVARVWQIQRGSEVVGSVELYQYQDDFSAQITVEAYEGFDSTFAQDGRNVLNVDITEDHGEERAIFDAIVR
jgi:serine/threonine protein kinase